MLMKMRKNVKSQLQHFFATNLYSCLKGNETSTKYEFAPYSLDEYLDVNEMDGNDGDDIDEFMLGHIVY